MLCLLCCVCVWVCVGVCWCVGGVWVCVGVWVCGCVLVCVGVLVLVFGVSACVCGSGGEEWRCVHQRQRQTRLCASTAQAGTHSAIAANTRPGRDGVAMLFTMIT